MESFAMLWEWEPTSLLTAMVESGMEAILIKVASYGLTKDHLGKTLGELQSHLMGLQTKYGIHCCGEGGEFESLTLDCPLFKKRIVL